MGDDTAIVAGNFRRMRFQNNDAFSRHDAFSVKKDPLLAEIYTNKAHGLTYLPTYLPTFLSMYLYVLYSRPPQGIPNSGTMGEGE